MTYQHVLTVQDEVVDAVPEWVTGMYMPVACPRCKDVRPGHERALDVDILGRIVGPIASVGYPISLTLYRADFFAAAHNHMSAYLFGAVTVRGCPLRNYVSVFVPAPARVPTYGDERSRYSACPTCGRQSDRLTPGAIWFKRDDVGERLVFTDHGGKGLYAAREFLDTLDPTLIRELKLSPVEVRD